MRLRRRELESIYREETRTEKIGFAYGKNLLDSQQLRLQDHQY